MKARSPLPTTQRSLLAVIAIGLTLMVGIIAYSQRLNTLLAKPTPTLASAAPTSVTSSPTAATTPNLTSTEVPLPLNDPRNFNVVPANLKPAQAFIEGKVTKFLMGM